MLIIQHIWTRWTKRTRGANSPFARPRLAETYPLPRTIESCEVFRHEIAAIERERDFEMLDRAGSLTADEWQRSHPRRKALLAWRIRKEGVEIRLIRPWSLQTRWPRALPSPLFVLRPGENVRIDWNGRLMASLFGSDRSTYYEQQTMWLALASAPEPRLFLDTSPRKHIDLRTEIY